MIQQIVETATARNTEPSIKTIEQFYAFRRPLEVSEFLEAHPFLLPLLVEAYDKIVECFGPHPEVILEVVTDPEAMDGRSLFAFIQTSLSPEEALSKLDRLDQEWWLDSSARSENSLCIHVEFA